ncbi:MAG TPA: hypothetical protein VMU15_14345 [Anaeromyxobacter sp.]|nr:hypothetical protein [Anaeromyxobacter sp.]
MAPAAPSPVVERAGFVLLEIPTWRVLGAVPFQFNPEGLRRRLALSELVVGPGPLALAAPGAPGAAEARERIELELVLDAADDLEDPEAHPETVRFGLLPRLDALRGATFPEPPLAAPTLLLLLLGVREARAVRALRLEVAEEELSPSLCPLRARARLELEVLLQRDLPPGGVPDLARQEAKQALDAAPVCP